MISGVRAANPALTNDPRPGIRKTAGPIALDLCLDSFGSCEVLDRLGAPLPSWGSLDFGGLCFALQARVLLILCFAWAVLLNPCTYIHTCFRCACHGSISSPCCRTCLRQRLPQCRAVAKPCKSCCCAGHKNCSPTICFVGPTDGA